MVINLRTGNPFTTLNYRLVYVCYTSRDGEAMGFYTPRLSSEAHHNGELTVSCFVEGTSLALTATADGKVIMWDNPYLGTTHMDVRP